MLRAFFLVALISLMLGGRFLTLLFYFFAITSRSHFLRDQILGREISAAFVEVLVYDI